MSWKLEHIRYKDLLIFLFALAVCASTWTCATTGGDQSPRSADSRVSYFAKPAQTIEVYPLSDTFWRVTSFLPNPPEQFKSMMYAFRRDGAIHITITNMDDTHKIIYQEYRIHKSTIYIRSADESITDYKFKFTGDKLILENESQKIEMKRYTG